MAYLAEVSGHKLECSLFRVIVWFSTLIFPFYKMLFVNRVNNMEQKAQAFCQSKVQEFHLWGEERGES
jgi:hypothetical protein